MNNPIVFAIMNSAQFSKFGSTPFKGNNCRLASDAVLGVSGVTQYSLDWVVPDSDSYNFIFMNPNSAAVDVVFVLWTRTVSTVRTTTQSSASTPITYKPTNNTPITTTVSIIPTQGSTTYSTSDLPISPVTINARSDFGWLLPVLVVAIAGIVTFMFVAYAYPRIRSRTTDPKVTEPRAAKSVSQTADKATSKLFCINCGAELPPKSKFCNSCGATQE